MSTFVSVGNLRKPFQRLLDAVAAVASLLPQPVIVQYGHGQYNAARCDARAFVPMDEFERFIRDAELIILHAGGGGVLYAIQAGKVPVIMPRRRAWGEHVDDHQLDNAEALRSAGKAIVIHDAAQLLPAVQEALALQRHRCVEPRQPELVRVVGDRLNHYAESVR